MMMSKVKMYVPLDDQNQLPCLFSSLTQCSNAYN